jgi:RHS repeat-associated protein
VQQSYDDGGLPTSTIYPDGETVTSSYTGQGWLSGLSTTQSGTTTTLLTNATYSGAAGAAGRLTHANLANSAIDYNASYDALGRLTSTSLTRHQDGATRFSQSRGYDAVGNVTSVLTTLQAGTDNQAFCYDELNRLTWASAASGSIPCGGTNTAGTLTSAQYSPISYSFDALDRQTAGNSNTFSYGDSAHLHAVTSTSSGWTAAYDAAGDMTCRAPASSTTCAGTPTGAVLTYDNEGRLTAWQNTPSNPTSTEAMAYDGEGNRVALKLNSGTPTFYLGGLEEISPTGVLTKYLGGVAPGVPTAERVGTGGPLSYLVSDGLGSLTEALDSSGNVTFQQLYYVYGGIRYTSGTAPTTQFFTGQRWDSTSGLSYDTARYYDTITHEFTSADTVDDGLNRYGYVHGNPTTDTDPSGHCIPDDDGKCHRGGCTTNCGGGYQVNGRGTCSVPRKLDRPIR